MNIFDASPFMPRFMCVHRDLWLAWLYVLPNIGIWLTYSFGFVTIYRHLSKKVSKARVPFLSTILSLYAVFFFFCGGTHFNDAIAMVWPAYWFFTIWEWIQFVVALFAFIYAIQIMKRYVP